MARQTYTWNQTTLDRAQVAQVLYQAGLTNPQAIAQLIPIAMRESGGRAGVHGSDSPQGNLTGDRGLFQINSTHDRNLIAAGIIRSAQDLFDPVINARAAAYLSNNGDPGRMRQLWGLGRVNGQTTWVGSSGSLPAPDHAAVQQAQSSGLFSRPYSPTSGSGGGMGQPPPPTGSTMYDILNAQNMARAGTDVAYTQAQREYAQQMAGYEQSLLGLNMTSLGYDQQALDVEQAYQDSLARLNSGLNQSQQDSNLKSWLEVGKNIWALQDLSKQGKANSEEYFNKSQALEKDILDATQKWLGQQKGFNQQDYNLALQAINNVVTTEAARFGQVKQQAQLTENIARRNETSDATARGARTSKGFSDALGEFEAQRGLTVQGGQISYDDAQRQATDARARSKLNYDVQAGGLDYQGVQANQQYQGASNQNTYQYQNAVQQYLQQQEDYRHRYAMGENAYMDRGVELRNQQGQNASRDAYNSAMYGINKAGLAVTGRRYGVNAGQSSAQLGNTLDNLSYGLASSMYANPVYTPQPQDLYGSSWPSGGSASQPPARRTPIRRTADTGVFQTSSGSRFE